MWFDSCGEKINKWMYRLLSNKDSSSEYEVRHKKKLLSLIFLTGSWFMAVWPVTALSDGVGLTLPWCFPPPRTFCSGRSHRWAVQLSSVLGWLSWAHRTGDGYVCIAWAWCCSLVWWCPSAELCLPLKQQNVEVLIRGAHLLSTSGWGRGVGGGNVEWRCCESTCRMGQ